ncbi:MAG: CotH kinase family protein [Candidatus Aegiribacteria sp.]|nr:CotH kinase family protein [Candidatus Aegiribacteria sp.]
MQIVLSAIILLGSQGTLDSYHLYIDQYYLDSLYADSLADLQFPAFIETPAGSCSCLAGFRGGTSLEKPKKSWKIELSDPAMLNASHVLLDAQYRDLSLMRNVLGLMLSRRLGFPAPLTEHVEFYINDIYYGVYVQVERIDEYFYSRNNIGYDPLFKSISHLGRFVWQPCDTLGTSGFDSERGSDEYLPLLRSLIDKVNLRSPLSLYIEDFISNAAISLAIRDEDAIIKNYYLHLPPEDIWRYYPWDRDASFGNRWDGEYEPQWVEATSMYCFEISSLLTNLFFNSENRIMFEDYMLQIAAIMENDIPTVIDSIYLEIRQSVYADTMKKGTNADFDEAVDILRSSIIERADFLPNIAEAPAPLEVVSMTLSQWDFQPGSNTDSVTVTIEFEQPPSMVRAYWWSNWSDEHYFSLNPNGSSNRVWNRTVAFPPDEDHMIFAIVYFVDTPMNQAEFYYPFYGFPTSTARRVCAPTARRSEYSAHHDDLVILAPIRYTSFLWSIPVVNTSSILQDISFYGFQVGDPPARLFAPEDASIPPGDTLYLTNSEELLNRMLPDENIFGNLVVDSPARTELIILDPSWATAATIILGEEVQSGESNLPVILSEICYSGNAGDWIELFNPGINCADLSGFLIIDGQNHLCMLPEDLIINPKDYLVICESYDSFYSVHGSDIDVIQGINFGLNDEKDGVSLLDEDKPVFSVMYDNATWPISDDCVLSLISPGLPLAEASSWEGVALPGTPGAPNPGWPTIVLNPLIKSLRPNPVLSSFSLDYVIPNVPGEVLVYDISGRLVVQPQLLDSFKGSYSCDLPESLRPGVYFAVIRSAGGLTSRKFILLR